MGWLLPAGDRSVVIKQEVAHLVFLSVDVVVHHHPTPAQSSGGTKAHGRPKPLCCYPFNVVFVVFAGLRKLSSTHWQDNTNCVRCIYTLSAAGPPWPLLAPMGFSASLSPRTPAALSPGCLSQGSWRCVLRWLPGPFLANIQMERGKGALS